MNNKDSGLGWRAKDEFIEKKGTKKLQVML